MEGPEYGTNLATMHSKQPRHQDPHPRYAMQRFFFQPWARILLLAFLLTLPAGLAAFSEDSAGDFNYIELVKNSTLSLNSTATVGEIFAAYPYFQSVAWSQFPYQNRIVVEARANYDIEKTMQALKRLALGQDAAEPEQPAEEQPQDNATQDATAPQGPDTHFVAKSIQELQEVTNVMYFSLDVNSTDVQPPSTSGLVHCRNGKNSTFFPGGATHIFTGTPPAIETLYRQCYN